MELPVWLIPGLSAVGFGAILGKLVDWLVNRKRKKVDLDVVVIAELRKEIDHLNSLRDEVRELRTEVRELRNEVKKLEEEADSHKTLLKKRDDFYYRAVRLVEEEPEATLRTKLRQLLDEMKALVLRKN